MIKDLYQDKTEYLQNLGYYASQQLKLPETQVFAIVMSEMLGLDNGKETFIKLAEWWQCWENHPFFEEYYKPDNYGFAPKLHILQPLVMATFKHEPGKYGKTESYVVCKPYDVIGQIRWGEKTFGEFTGIIGIPEDIELNPGIKSRIGHISYSLKGSGKAYWSRYLLKQVLPRQLHKYLQKARKVNRDRKFDLLHFYIDPDEYTKLRQTRGARRKPSLWPKEARSKSKAEIFVENLIDPEDLKVLQQYMDPITFYEAATGKYDPNTVQSLVNHQQELFELPAREPKPRREKPVERKPSIMAEQLSLLTGE